MYHAGTTHPSADAAPCHAPQNLSTLDSIPICTQRSEAKEEKCLSREEEIDAAYVKMRTPIPLMPRYGAGRVIVPSMLGALYAQVAVRAMLRKPAMTRISAPESPSFRNAHSKPNPDSRPTTRLGFWSSPRRS